MPGQAKHALVLGTPWSTPARVAPARRHLSPPASSARTRRRHPSPTAGATRRRHGGRQAAPPRRRTVHGPADADGQENFGPPSPASPLARGTRAARPTSRREPYLSLGGISVDGHTGRPCAPDVRAMPGARRSPTKTSACPRPPFAHGRHPHNPGPRPPGTRATAVAVGAAP